MSHFEDLAIINEGPAVGLFGNCGTTTFRRDKFIPILEQEGIDYFNPQLGPGEWNEGFAPLEAAHLAYDPVQLWPATGETLACGTLAETGYAVARTLNTESPLPKFMVTEVDAHLNDDVEPDNPLARKESTRARALVLSHLAKNPSPTVFQVNNLDDMIEVGVVLHGAAARIIETAQSYSPSYRRFMEGRSAAAAYRQALESGQLGADAQAIATR